MTHTYPLTSHDAPVAKQTPAIRKPNLLQRFYSRLMQAQQKRAERDIAHFLARSGGRFTDSTEREIERRFGLSRSSSFY